MKKILLVLFLIPAIAYAQEEKDSTWIIGGNMNLNFSQVSLTNWAAGGNSSGTGVLMLNLSGNYKKDNVSWDNSADLRLGFLKEGDNDLRKSDDNIDINSKLGISANERWLYSLFLNFKSQFAEGYNYPDKENLISKFMAPGYLSMGLGMDYKVEKMSLLLAPVSGKFTFVLDDDLADEGAFGVDPGKKTRSELGASVKFNYKTDLVKNVTFETNLDLFSNYLNNPENIDIDWKVLINMKVNDFLSANLVTQLIYDDDVKILDPDTGHSAPRTQFMEMFGAGLTFKF